MMRMVVFIIVGTLGCGDSPAGSGEPRRCVTGAECGSGAFCGDPERGLLLGRGDEKVPPGTIGQCCANGNFALNPMSRGGVYGCDNLCGGTGQNDGNPNYGCFKKLGDAFNAKLRECDQPCTSSEECVRGAFCDTQSGSGICVPRTCGECAEMGADCFYDKTRCSDDVRSITISSGTYLLVECRPRKCTIPCDDASDCSDSVCLGTAGGKMCLPSSCSSCFSSQQRCDVDPYTCGFFACSGCVPSCAGKMCGSDGCSGSCGTCPGATDVCASGTCVACPDEGQPCQPASPRQCRTYSISCDSGQSVCKATGRDTGAACTIYGQAGHCTSIGSCLADNPSGSTSGSTGGTTGSTTGSGGGSCDATSCVTAIEYLDTPYYDYMCENNSSYFYRYQNNCQQAVYCAFCAGGATDCALAQVEAGKQITEWAEASNLHCSPPDSGGFYNCVPATDYGCRALLEDQY